MSITVRRDGITGTRHILRIRGHEIPVDAKTPAARTPGRRRTTSTIPRSARARRSRCWSMRSARAFRWKRSK